jgi:class 3 adenylate cyclase
MEQKKQSAYVLLALGIVRFVADVALVSAIGGLLVLFGLQFPHSPKLDTLWFIEKLRFGGDAVLSTISRQFGWTWPSGGISLLPVGMGFAVWVLKRAFDGLTNWTTGQIRKRLPLPDEALALSASASSMGISVSSTLLALAAVSDTAREKIQRRHARVARMLREVERRRCTFLSIDVVNPDEMKLDEDPDAVESSFRAYEVTVQEVLRLCSAWKEAWTPDGVMACFLDLGHGVEAAQRVLMGIGDLNAQRNRLKRPFRVRCGLNEGEVIIFEDSRLEKVADRVIDIAGHMQKRARPDTLWLSSGLAERLGDRYGFRPAGAQVDGLAVHEWHP